MKSSSVRSSQFFCKISASENCLLQPACSSVRFRWAIVSSFFSSETFCTLLSTILPAFAASEASRYSSSSDSFSSSPASRIDGGPWGGGLWEGIYMTLMLKPDINPNHASMLTLVTAMAVANAMHRVTGAEALIKWPNDIVINGKKICGILTEMSAQFDYINHIVIGIGINVHNEDLRKKTAGS